MVIRPAEGPGIEGLAEIEKGYVDLLHALAGGWRRRASARKPSDR